jgi:exodeoxyribonuclease VII small subunit
MEMSFEESLRELEGIADKLEEGKLSLDESLLLFEKGIKLVRECNTKLKDARQNVEELILENGDIKP